MTATVAGMLDRLHAQAFAISNLATRPSEDRWRAHAVVWPRLALATMRALNNVPAGAATDPALVLVDSVLNPIARNEWIPRISGTPAANVPPDKRLVDITRVLGGIADLLSIGLKDVVSDSTAVLGLRSNLLAPVMVAANWSLATAPDVARNLAPRRHLQLVSGIGTAFAFVPVGLRPGQYDDIAAVPHSENSLDAAMHNWLDATKEALATRKGLSGITLQTIAADLSVLCGVAAATTNAAIALGQLAEDRGRPVVEAIRDANTKWREASRWPQTIYLGGVRDTALADASIHLRQTAIDTLRDGKSWADPTVIAKRMNGQDLASVARRAMHIAAEAAQLHQEGLVRRQMRHAVLAGNVRGAHHHAFLPREALLEADGPQHAAGDGAAHRHAVQLVAQVLVGHVARPPHHLGAALLAKHGCTDHGNAFLGKVRHSRADSRPGEAAACQAPTGSTVMAPSGTGQAKAQSPQPVQRAASTTGRPSSRRRASPG